MSNTNTSVVTNDGFMAKLSDYAVLVKLRLTLLVVFTSVLASFIAADGMYSFDILGLLMVGGFLITSAANALNQVLEKDYDIFMTRTADRPVAKGRMRPTEAVLFAGLTSMIGIVMLAFINPVTCFLGSLSFVMYTFVYTPMKRYSTMAVPVGAIPGALPVLIGCTAIEGTITVLGISLFMIQFLWQFPHFWSIGFLAFDDYKNAGYKLIPEKKGMVDRSLGMNAMFYAGLLLPLIGGMYYLGVIGFTSMLLTMILSIVYLMASYSFHKGFDRKSALRLMFSSFFYMPLVLFIYLIIG